MFKMKLWHPGFAQILGTAAFAVAIYALAASLVSFWWLLPMAVMHFVLTGFGGVGAHLYFCHQAFNTNRFWDVIMALGTCLLVIGSPLQWCIGHTAHHDYTDTPQDPHPSRTWQNLWGFWLGKYNVPDKYSFRYAGKLIRDKFQLWLHRNALVVPLVFSGVLTAIGLATLPLASAWVPLVFVYLAPAGTTLWAGAAHNVLSHWGGKPRDLPVFFFLLPWEWPHASHHDEPRNPNKAFRYKYLPDPAYWVIKAIRK